MSCYLVVKRTIYFLDQFYIYIEQNIYKWKIPKRFSVLTQSSHFFFFPSKQSSNSKLINPALPIPRRKYCINPYLAETSTGDDPLQNKQAPLLHLVTTPKRIGIFSGYFSGFLTKMFWAALPTSFTMSTWHNSATTSYQKAEFHGYMYGLRTPFA